MCFVYPSTIRPTGKKDGFNSDRYLAQEERSDRFEHSTVQWRADCSRHRSIARRTDARIRHSNCRVTIRVSVCNTARAQGSGLGAHLFPAPPPISALLRSVLHAYPPHRKDRPTSFEFLSSHLQSPPPTFITSRTLPAHHHSNTNRRTHAQLEAWHRQ